MLTGTVTLAETLCGTVWEKQYIMQLGRKRDIHVHVYNAYTYMSPDSLLLRGVLSYFHSGHLSNFVEANIFLP